MKSLAENIVGSCGFIHSAFFLIGGFKQFAFKVIIDKENLLLIVTDILFILWSLYSVGMGGNYSRQIKKRIFLKIMSLS